VDLSIGGSAFVTSVIPSNWPKRTTSPSSRGVENPCRAMRDGNLQAPNPPLSRGQLPRLGMAAATGLLSAGLAASAYQGKLAAPVRWSAAQLLLRVSDAGR
jgi:hypothetical protein